MLNISPIGRNCSRFVSQMRSFNCAMLFSLRRTLEARHHILLGIVRPVHFMLTFSPTIRCHAHNLPRNLPTHPHNLPTNRPERNAFEEFDKTAKVRTTMVGLMEKEFAELGLKFSIGGQISFDVFPIGWQVNKCPQPPNPPTPATRGKSRLLYSSAFLCLGRAVGASVCVCVGVCAVCVGGWMVCSVCRASVARCLAYLRATHIPPRPPFLYFIRLFFFLLPSPAPP